MKKFQSATKRGKLYKVVYIKPNVNMDKVFTDHNVLQQKKNRKEVRTTQRRWAYSTANSLKWNLTQNIQMHLSFIIVTDGRF